MDSLTILWFVGIGLLFFFMMRFGCGAHVVHGDDDPNARSSSNPSDTQTHHH
jgi:hypothetical protein